MATQLKNTDFTPTTRPAIGPIPLPARDFYKGLAPRPNIRVAFIAGEAATAVHDAMAKLPADTRDGTLDDLVWDQGVADPADVQLIQSMACSLIETARDLLSPTMYTAFLRWGETASHACSFYTSDDDGDARCAATAEARSLVSSITAENVHDLLFMMLLACIETADAPSFGPFDRQYGEFDVNGSDLLGGLSRDLRTFSPIPDLVNELSARAWDASKCKLAISAEVGRAITSAFSFARGEDVAHLDASPSAIVMDGYDPFMRGPYINWTKNYDRYVTARSDRLAYERGALDPAHARFSAVRAKSPIGYDFQADPVAFAAIEAVGYDDIEDRFGDLVSAEHVALESLLLCVAPGPAELATKLKLLLSEEMWTVEKPATIFSAIARDARRFGRHGAHLQTDKALLTAFAARRHELEAADRGPWTAEQEDAYFGRVDAAEMVLLATPATTIEGVIAKLRLAFMNQVGTDWSDLAIANTADPKFVEGLRMSGMYERMAWGAIEDLARIAGVGLAEQGA